MSLDFQAFFPTKPKRLPASVADADWVLNVETAIRIEPDDLSPGLRAMLGKRSWQVDLHLEGEATRASTNALERVTNELIAAGGAVVDMQRDIVRDVDGERPVVQFEDGRQDDRGFSLHILFNDADRVSTKRMATLLDIIEQELPDALPHRYGTFEPPPYRWDAGGAEAFLKRWDRKDAPFWIGKSPVSYVFSSFDFIPGSRTSALRAGRFDFQFRSKLGSEPGKLLGVLRLAERFALELDAFYVALVPGDESHGPYWKGLIPTDHLMLILGRPLLNLWPEFEKVSQPLGGIHRAAGGSKSGTVRIRPPKEICYPAPASEAEPSSPAIRGAYAERFPFAKQDPYI